MSPWRVIHRGLSVLVLPLLAYGCFEIGKISMSEGCYWPNPQIDTRFAEGYNEEVFMTVVPGMDKEAVLAKLGPPMSMDTLDDGRQIWDYSRDGAASPYDFAWMGREVWLDEAGKVIQLNTPTHGD
jgi:hypothetical protein